MIPDITIDAISAAYFYDEYELGAEDIEEIIELFNKEEDQDALDVFIERFIINPSDSYSDAMRYYLNSIDSGAMTSTNQNQLITSVALLTAGLVTLLSKNFRTYVKDIYSGFIYDKVGLKKKAIQSAISSEVISEYEQLISGTLSNTQNFIVNAIRTVQREIIAENLFITKQKLSGVALTREIERFKSSLKTRYPNVYKAVENGNLITTRSFKDGKEATRHYKLDYYADLSTRTTLLNIDRITNEVVARSEGDKVVGYELVDSRNVKKEREICQQILSKEILGRSILALDDNAAVLLGIMTVDEAKSTPDYAMGPYCRHSLVKLDKEYLDQIDLLLGNRNVSNP